MSAILAGADTMELHMSFRLTLAGLALLAPLAICPAIAQTAMSHDQTMTKSGMSDTGMSHMSMSKNAMHARKHDGAMGGSAMGSGAMAPASGSAPHS